MVPRIPSSKRKNVLVLLVKLGRDADAVYRIERLVSGSSSHSFVIDHEETRELFANAREPTDNEATVANRLGLSSTDRAYRAAHSEVRYITSLSGEG